MVSGFFDRELGFSSVLSSHSTRDIFLLYASRFIRLFAFGAVTPILVLHLRLMNIPDELVGLFLSLTLVGDVVLSLIVTWVADSLGRRNVLAGGAGLMLIAGVTFALSENYLVLLFAAVVGVISPSGSEVGPFSAVEVGILSQLVDPEARVFVLMWYQVLGFVGTALGALATGIIVATLTRNEYQLVNAYRAVYLVYVLVALIKIALSLAMTDHSELNHPPRVIKSPTTGAPIVSTSAGEREPLIADPYQTEPVHDPTPAPLPLLKLSLLCLLFSLDSFGGSLIPISFISYYFKIKFDAGIEAITRTFSAGSLIMGVSQLGAGSLARRIGIIPTMVFTHMPSQLLTIALAFAPTLASALTIFIARACICSMDVSVRGAFLSGIVPKESRTRFLGIINVCKTLASAPGPTLAGVFASFGGLRWTFVIAGSVKLIYDISLWITFKTATMNH